MKNTVSKYQIFPPLTPEEFTSLKQSISEIGVEIPIIVDSDGNIIDGFHRKLACDDLGISCPTAVRQFNGETEKFELAMRLNCGRRQLNQKQKRDVIQSYLLRDPQIADNYLAQIIGVSKNTVASVRDELEKTRQIKKYEVLRGKDGKDRPKKYKKVVANTPKEVEQACAAMPDLPESCSGRTIDVTTAKRRAARNRNAQAREEQGNVVIPSSDDDIRLYHCPFQQLESAAGIEPGTVSLVCTDIPYGKEFLPQVEELGRFAERILVDGGIFVTYSGQFWLHKVIESLGKSLQYRWVNASVWNGDANPIHMRGWGSAPTRIISKWKPILIFSKGDLSIK